jgi:hypothetical protein
MPPPVRRHLLQGMAHIYRLMLLAYPAEFRREYSREIELAFRNRLDEVVELRGAWALPSFLMRTLWDWLKTTVMERTDMTGRHGTHTVSALQLILILPAALFLSSVVVRNVPPFSSGAQWVVMLYVGKVWTLWLLLLLLPLLVLVTGCLTLLRVWNEPHDVAIPQPFSVAVVQASATRRVAAMSVLSAGILVTVVLHMLAS